MPPQCESVLFRRETTMPATASSASEMTIGYMPMPLNFKYKDIFLRGRPEHEKYDDFWRKHLPMPVTRWAKIFSPFDALAGFNEAVASKRVPYESRRNLSETEKCKLDHALSLIRPLIRDGKPARANRPEITATFFVPCNDIRSEWYGKGGRYETLTGICEKIDDIARTIIVNGRSFSFDDIITLDLLRSRSYSSSVR